MGPKEAKIAVFETNDELELFRIGEVVRSQFRLVDFKYESVVIGYVDDRFKGMTTELEQSR